MVPVSSLYHADSCCAGGDQEKVGKGSSHNRLRGYGIYAVGTLSSGNVWQWGIFHHCICGYPLYDYRGNIWYSPGGICNFCGTFCDFWLFFGGVRSGRLFYKGGYGSYPKVLWRIGEGSRDLQLSFWQHIGKRHCQCGHNRTDYHSYDEAKRLWRCVFRSS